MATKRLDVTVSKESIERNFNLLNAALAGYDKQIAALHDGGASDAGEGLTDTARAEIHTLIAGKMKEIERYIKKLLAEIGEFNLNDYRCTFATVTAREYITFLIVDDQDNERAKLGYDLATNRWQIAYEGGAAFAIGDMQREVYDTNDNGIVDMADGVTYIEPTPVEDGQALLWDGATGKFKPGNVANSRNVDGGSASSVYLSTQVIDGGGASG